MVVELLFSCPLAVMVTSRPVKSSVQPLGTSNILVMLHGPVPLGQPGSCKLMLAAVQAVRARATLAKPTDATKVLSRKRVITRCGRATLPIRMSVMAHKGGD